MGCRGIDLYAGIAGDGYDIGAGADFEGDVDADGGVGIDREVGFTLRIEAGRGDGEVVMTDGEIGEGVETLPVGDRFVGRLLRGADEVERGAWDDGAGLICDGAGDAASGGSVQERCGEEDEGDRQTE